MLRIRDRVEKERDGLLSEDEEPAPTKLISKHAGVPHLSAEALRIGC